MCTYVRIVLLIYGTILSDVTLSKASEADDYMQPESYLHDLRENDPNLVPLFNESGAISLQYRPESRKKTFEKAK